MTVQDARVVITGAARDFGRTLALRFAERDAEVILTSRRLTEVERTRDELIAAGHRRVHALECDLSEPASIRACAKAVADRFGGIDILVNNGAGWLEGRELADADDEEIVGTIASGVTGTVLMTKHFLPLLAGSTRPDVVTMVSMAAAMRGDACSGGNPAFYAAKGGQANFAEIMSQRLRAEGIRMITLYPPDFDNIDPFSPDWTEAPRTPEVKLTARSVSDCVLFAVEQPRDCFIRSFHFEPVQRRH